MSSFLSRFLTLPDWLSRAARMIAGQPRVDPGKEMIFFNPEQTLATGLVGVGGDLRPERLLQAYRHGVFPWYDEDSPIMWWSPDPRAIFELDGLYISRRLWRTVHSGKFIVTVNRNFAGVIRGCAKRKTGTWISPEMIEAYETMHQLGHAHSLEVWHDGFLAGGIYGVAIGGFFAGESMFTRVRDASKVALVHLMDRLRRRGFQLFDVQFRTDHTTRLGAIEIPRDDYLERLQQALAVSATFTGASQPVIALAEEEEIPSTCGLKPTLPDEATAVIEIAEKEVVLPK